MSCPWVADGSAAHAVDVAAPALAITNTSTTTTCLPAPAHVHDIALPGCSTTGEAATLSMPSPRPGEARGCRNSIVTVSGPHGVSRRQSSPVSNRTSEPGGCIRSSRPLHKIADVHDALSGVHGGLRGEFGDPSRRSPTMSPSCSRSTAGYRHRSLGGRVADVPAGCVTTMSSSFSRRPRLARASSGARSRTGACGS